MKFVFLIVFLLASVISGILTAISVWKNKRDYKRIIFSLMCFQIFLFSFFTGILQLPKSAFIALVLFKAALFGVFFYAPLVLNLVLRLRNRKQKKLVFFMHLFVSAVFFLWVAFTDDFILTMSYKSSLWIPVFAYSNPWLYVVLFKFVYYTFVCAVLILFWGRESKLKKVKFQSRLLTISLLFGDSMGIVCVIINPVLIFYTQIPFLLVLSWIVLRTDFLELNYNVHAKAIIENISDAVFILRPDFNIHCKNAAALKITSEENEYFPDLIENNESFAEALAILDKTTQNEKRIAVEFKDKNSTSADIRISKIKDWFGDNSGYLIISRENPGINHFKKQYEITDRQMEIIQMTINGLSNDYIAEKLGLTRRTVETHLFNIYNKLSINSKIELAKIANNFNLFEKE